MKRCFHRALWGKYHTSDEDSRLIKRRARCDGWITKILNHEHTAPFRTYVFGKSNYMHLEDLGVENLVLVDKNPAPFDLLHEQYRHKLEAIKACFEEGYDEVMHLDWDVIPQRPMDENYWKLMNEGAEFQANLQQYRRIKTPWREAYSQDLRKIPNGGYFYLRNKDYIYEIIKCWETLMGRSTKKSHPSCEPSMAMFVERFMENEQWEGKQAYWDMGFEPMTCDLHRCSCYRPEERNKEKTLYFIHYQG